MKQISDTKNSINNFQNHRLSNLRNFSSFFCNSYAFRTTSSLERYSFGCSTFSTFSSFRCSKVSKFSSFGKPFFLSSPCSLNRKNDQSSQTFPKINIRKFAIFKIMALNIAIREKFSFLYYQWFSFSVRTQLNESQTLKYIKS